MITSSYLLLKFILPFTVQLQIKKLQLRQRSSMSNPLQQLIPSFPLLFIMAASTTNFYQLDVSISHKLELLLLLFLKQVYNDRVHIHKYYNYNRRLQRQHTNTHTISYLQLTRNLQLLTTQLSNWIILFNLLLLARNCLNTFRALL